MAHMKDSGLFRIISLVLITTFIAFDISWAYPSNPSEKTTLAVQGLFQQQMMTPDGAMHRDAILSNMRLLTTVRSIAKILLTDRVRIKYLESTLTAELGKVLIEGMDLSRVAVKGGVVLIPYVRNRKKYVIQIALKGTPEAQSLKGRDWPALDKDSDTYVIKVLSGDQEIHSLPLGRAQGRQPIVDDKKRTKTPDGAAEQVLIEKILQTERYYKEDGGCNVQPAFEAAYSMLEELHDQGHISEVAWAATCDTGSILYRFFDEALKNATVYVTDKYFDAKLVGGQIILQAVIRDGELWLEVLDNGGGFSEEALERAGKERFTTTTDSDLRGWFLYIFTIEAEKMGWRLIIENRKDTQGARVALVIPQAKGSRPGMKDGEKAYPARESIFALNTEALKDVARNFRSDIETRSTDRSSLSDIVTEIGIPTGHEKGNYLFIDLGGTNLRVGLVELKGDRTLEKKYELSTSVPQNIVVSGGNTLFEFIAKTIKAFADEHQLSGELEIGFTFSFAMKKLGVNRGIITPECNVKGYNFDKVVGQEVVTLLNRELAKINLANVRITALVNDTEGVRDTGAYLNGKTIAGGVFGTGHNTAIRNTKGSSVNLESGAFDKLASGEEDPEVSALDKEVDGLSSNPGAHPLEKRLSGKYVGPLFGLKLESEIRNKKLFANHEADLPAIFTDHQYEEDDYRGFTGKHISEIEERWQSGGVNALKDYIEGTLGIRNPTDDDAKRVRSIEYDIMLRSAQLGTATFAGIVMQREQTETPTSEYAYAVDGSLLNYPGYIGMMKAALADIFGKEYAAKLEVFEAKDGAGIGAAITAMIISTQAGTKSFSAADEAGGTMTAGFNRNFSIREAPRGPILSETRPYPDAKALHRNNSPVYTYNGREYGIQDRWIPKSQHAAVQEIDEEQLLWLALTGPGWKVVVAEDYDMMTYGALYVAVHMMEMAHREFALGLATGGTTETYRKAMGLLDNSARILGGLSIPADKINKWSTLDNYYWPRSAQDIDVALSSYTQEQQYMLLNNLYGRVDYNYFVTPFDKTSLTLDETAQDFRMRMRIFLDETYRILIQLHGIGSDGHDAFNEIYAYLALLRKDYGSILLGITQVQNIGHFLPENNGFHPFFLRFMADNYIFSVERLTAVLKILGFENIRAYYSESKYQFKTKEEFDAALEHMLNNYTLTPAQAVSQGTGDIAERTGNVDSLNLFLSSSYHKAVPLHDAVELIPSIWNTGSGLQLYASSLVITDLDAAVRGKKQLDLSKVFFFVPEGSGRAFARKEVIEEAWKSTKEGERIQGLLEEKHGPIAVKVTAPDAMNADAGKIQPEAVSGEKKYPAREDEPSEVRQWIEKLSGSDVSIRREAAETLVKMGKTAVTALIDALKNKERDVRVIHARTSDEHGPDAEELIIAGTLEDIARILGNIGPEAKEAIPALMALLSYVRSWHDNPTADFAIGDHGEVEHYSDTSVKRAAIEAIGKIGSATPEVILALVKALEDSSLYVRDSAEEALEKLDSLTTELKIKRYIADLRENNGAEALLESAEEALVKIGEPAASALIIALGDPDSDVRKSAMKILEKLNFLTTELKIKRYISDLRDRDDKGARWPAEKALVKIGEPVVPALVIALGDSDSDVRDSAMEILEKLNFLTTELKIKRYIADLGAGNFDVNKRAMEALVKIGEPAVPALAGILKNTDSHVRSTREEIIRALGNIGPKAKDAIPALREALMGADINVSRAVENAMRKIDGDFAMERDLKYSLLMGEIDLAAAQSKVKEAKKAVLFEAGKLLDFMNEMAYMQGVSDDRDFSPEDGYKPLILALGSPSTEAFVAAAKEYNNRYRKIWGGRPIPIITSTGRGRGAIALMSNTLKYYKDRPDSLQAFNKLSEKPETLTEARIIELIFRTEGIKDPIFIEEESNNTLLNVEMSFDRFINAIYPPEQKVKILVVADVFHRPRANLTAMRVFRRKAESRKRTEWKIVAGPRYAYSLADMDDAKLLGEGNRAGYLAQFIGDPYKRDGRTGAWNDLGEIGRYLNEAYELFDPDNPDHAALKNRIRTEWAEQIKYLRDVLLKNYVDAKANLDRSPASYGIEPFPSEVRKVGQDQNGVVHNVIDALESVNYFTDDETVLRKIDQFAKEVKAIQPASRDRVFDAIRPILIDEIFREMDRYERNAGSWQHRYEPNNARRRAMAVGFLGETALRPDELLPMLRETLKDIPVIDDGQAWDGDEEDAETLKRYPDAFKDTYNFSVFTATVRVLMAMGADASSMIPDIEKAIESSKFTDGLPREDISAAIDAARAAIKTIEQASAVRDGGQDISGEKKYPVKGPDEAGTTGLFEMLESRVNNERTEIVEAANKVIAAMFRNEAFRANVGAAGLEKVQATAVLKNRMERAILTVESLDEKHVPVEIQATIDHLKKRIDQLEADGIVASVINLARRAKYENQKLIIGLETDWIPGYNEVGSLQHQAMNPIIQQIESIPDILRSMGLDNVVLVHANSKDIADSLIKEAARASTKLSNVVVLASKGTVESSSFDSLRSTPTEAKAFIAAIDPMELEKFFRANKDPLKHLDIKILEMLSIALDIAAGKEPPDIPMVISYDRSLRIIMLLPKAEPKNYEEINRNYYARKTALAAA
jgi:hexokinase